MTAAVAAAGFATGFVLVLAYFIFQAGRLALELADAMSADEPSECPWPTREDDVRIKFPEHDRRF